MAEWIKTKQNKKQKDLTICHLQEIYLSFKDTQKLKVKRQKQIFHENINPKRIGAAIFILDKIDFKPKKKKW